MALLRACWPSPPYPVFTWAFVAGLILVFFSAAVALGPFYFTGLGGRRDGVLDFYEAFGVVPLTLGYRGLAGLLTLVTGLFVHTGPFHLLTNLVFFRLFSAPLEDAFGSAQVGGLSLAAGVVGASAHCWVYPDSPFALVGASGVVSGLAVALLVCPGGPHVLRVGPVILGRRLAVPAWEALLVWLGLQLLALVVHLFGGGHATLPLVVHGAGALVGLIVCLVWRRFLWNPVRSDQDLPQPPRA